jgi:CubicO group peptidase (beta-lactamase class C family)
MRQCNIEALFTRTQEANVTVDPRIAQVDRLFTEWAKSDSPGCSLAIMIDGEIVYKQGYGMANLEYHIPITPSTIFHVASVSKQFAAMAIALLQKEGKLSADDDIRKYLPEMHDFGDTITIRHLVQHTSGLRDQWELLIAAGWRMEDVITSQDMLDLIFQQRELNFKPGAEYVYSNTGYTLMAEIVKRVSGKSLRAFCDEYIFKPLGMNDTHFHDDHQEIVPNRAYSYYPHNGGFKHSHLLYATAGATSLFTTVEDLMRWQRNFLDPVVGGWDVLAVMQTPGVLNGGEKIEYAFGLLVTQYRGLKVVEHSGGDAGFRTHLIGFPDQRLSIAVLSNLATMMPGRLARQIADIYLNDQMTSAAETVIQRTEAQLAKRIGLYQSAALARTVRLVYRDEGLVMQYGYDLPLEMLDENRFRVTFAPNIKLTFLDQNGERSPFELDTGGGKQARFEPIEAAKPSLEALAEYAGKYVCPELDVHYFLAVKDDQLQVQRRKYGSTPLIPSGNDSFADERMGMTLAFSRNAANQVTGFRLSSGRLRHVQFARQGS